MSTRGRAAAAAGWRHRGMISAEAAIAASAMPAQSSRRCGERAAGDRAEGADASCAGSGAAGVAGDAPGFRSGGARGPCGCRRARPANARGQRLRVRARRGVELRRQPAGEVFVKTQRAAGVARVHEQIHGAPQRAFVHRIEGGGAPGPRGRRLEVAGVPLAVDERRERAGDEAGDARALRRQPFLECLAGIREVQSGEQLAAVQVHRLRVASGGDGIAEHPDVAGEQGGVDRHGVVAASDDHALAQGVAQVVERVAERAAGGELVQVRPEHRGQRVATVVAVALAECQVGEQGEALGLREE